MKLALGLVITTIIPIFIVWQFNLFSMPSIMHITTLIMTIMCYLFYSVTLDKMSKYPGEHSGFLIIPNIITWYGLGLFIMELFNLTYSIWFIVIHILLISLMSYIFIIYKQKTAIPTVYYIPFGRAEDLHKIANVYWIRLDTPDESITDMVTLVTDLHSPELNDTWQKFLANKTLQGVDVYNVRQIRESLTGRIKILHMYENDLGSLQPSMLYLHLKQFIDALLVILSLPFTLPIMLATALAIKLDDGGSIFYIQERIGYRGKLFNIYKFRTMTEGSHTQTTTKNDKRITRLGHILRKTRIDELPQFFNVLKGEISLIGPRAEYKAFADELEKQVPFFQYRHIVKPGISGWAQVIQGYATGPEETQIKLEHDFYYIKHFSISLDILIFFKTLQTMVTGFGSR